MATKKPRMRHGGMAAWIASEQGKHHCGCGCGGAIPIQCHHYSRGIPQYLDGHKSRVNNPMKGRFGELNPHFKRGWYVNQLGYVVMLNPDSNDPKYILEHRHVMSRHIGRPLRDDEVVHHINRNKADNRIENLEIRENADHSSEHARCGETGVNLLRRLGRRFEKGRPCPS